MIGPASGSSYTWPPGTCACLMKRTRGRRARRVRGRLGPQRLREPKTTARRSGTQRVCRVVGAFARCEQDGCAGLRQRKSAMPILHGPSFRRSAPPSRRSPALASGANARELCDLDATPGSRSTWPAGRPHRAAGATAARLAAWVHYQQQFFKDVPLLDARQRRRAVYVHGPSRIRTWDRRIMSPLL